LKKGIYKMYEKIIFEKVAIKELKDLLKDKK
jgi:hypothetical protein